MSEKSKSEILREELFLKRKNGRLISDEEILKKADDYCVGYKQFLDLAKTEREAVKTAVDMAKKAGFTEFQRGKKYNAGDRVYFNNRGKTVAFAVIGKENAENGMNITAAHVDSPRLDLKPNPLYEDIELALFKTHYYGGIK
ncbi:MAG: aminopeptidase, partial [Clostridia bacterium]|nr:aminopeptidase [Clostridia bacterium]